MAYKINSFKYICIWRQIYRSFIIFPLKMVESFLDHYSKQDFFSLLPSNQTPYLGVIILAKKKKKLNLGSLSKIIIIFKLSDHSCLGTKKIPISQGCWRYDDITNIVAIGNPSWLDVYNLNQRYSIFKSYPKKTRKKSEMDSHYSSLDCFHIVFLRNKSKPHTIRNS